MKTINQTRQELLEELRAMPQILDRGKWAVACVGMRGWCSDYAIGDGITSALAALRTRCQTQKEAEELAEKWNDAQPGVLPGSPSVFVYEARKYNPNDYFCKQSIKRDCDRKIA